MSHIMRIQVALGKIVAIGPGAGGLYYSGNIKVADGDTRQSFTLPEDELRKLRVGQHIRLSIEVEG
jgi:hypothetical protein